jgi:acyl carrier protein
MANIEEIVLTCYQCVLDEIGLNITADIKNKVGKETGLDSLGFVNLILSIEEKLNKELDPVLIELRKCKNLEEIIKIIAGFYKE